MVYHPPQRPIAARVLSLGRWIRATFHVPKLHAFDDHLANGRTFFTLTDVDLGAAMPIPFLALRVSAAHVVVPEVPSSELLLQSTSGTAPREVSCYLEHLAVRGRLELRAGVRTSDFLAHREGFIVLRACRLVPALPGRAEPLPVVLVNARAVVALAEEGRPE
jgi:hypothetical protein